MKRTKLYTFKAGNAAPSRGVAMKTLISTRTEKFRRLLIAAAQHPTDWLESSIRLAGPKTDKLALLACLRELACRDRTSGKVYRERRKIIQVKLLGETNA